MFVKLRPQAAGIADIPKDNPEIKESINVLKSIDVKNKKMNFAHRQKGNDTKEFKYFKEILPDDMDQETVYNTMMPYYMDMFSQGFNVNFLAYG